MGHPLSISPADLYARIGTAGAPVLLDVRRAASFDSDESLIVAASRRDPDRLADWVPQLPGDRPVVVYCVHGHEVSRSVAATLHARGGEPRYLDGGIAGWTELGLPRRRKAPASPCGWITRERPKIDRIACPWLIRRFIDPEARFLFAPTERVLDIAKATGATAFDIPGAEPFSHDGEACSFDAFLRVYDIEDRTLDALALIVRGADTARLDLAPQSHGLLALSLGLSANFANDHEMLEHGMVMYDALYAWCRNCRGEAHNWTPEERA
jgi:rhodanese-related sulfurtransferase